MGTKICSKCKIEKDICNFSRKKSNHSELRSECKECNRIISKKYREENKVKEINRSKKYREENKEKLKKTYIDNIDYFLSYRQKNKQYFENYNKIYYDNNRSKMGVPLLSSKNTLKKNSPRICLGIWWEKKYILTT